MSNSKDEVERIDWLEAELADTIDEDYELELSEPTKRILRRFPAWIISARSWRCKRS